LKRSFCRLRQKPLTREEDRQKIIFCHGMHVILLL